MKRKLLAIVLALAVLACAVFLSSGYGAQKQAVAAMTNGQTIQGGHAVFGSPDAECGLIFYPGGLVDHAAYAPLMDALAREGWLCVLISMPLDLAVLNVNAAGGVQTQYPQVRRWAIGGHSLGGAMAASYAAEHAEDFDALVLLAAYSTADLTGTDLQVLSLYGSEDHVMNRDKYAQYQANLPASAREAVIEGGNHAGFGDYGAQKGDGMASITAERQVQITVDELTKEMAQ